MLKDPNHTEETPYELLGLSFDAPLSEVRTALPRFMRQRKKIARLGRAQEAVRKLQNGAARAGIDIWFYHADALDEEAGQSVREFPALEEFRQVHPEAPEMFYCDLEGADLTAECREITLQKMRLSDVRTLDGLDDIHFRPHFDR